MIVFTSTSWTLNWTRKTKGLTGTRTAWIPRNLLVGEYAFCMNFTECRTSKVLFDVTLRLLPKTSATMFHPGSATLCALLVDAETDQLGNFNSFEDATRMPFSHVNHGLTSQPIRTRFTWQPSEFSEAEWLSVSDARNTNLLFIVYLFVDLSAEYEKHLIPIIIMRTEAHMSFRGCRNQIAVVREEQQFESMSTDSDFEHLGQLPDG